MAPCTGAQEPDATADQQLLGPNYEIDEEEEEWQEAPQPLVEDATAEEQ